MAIDSTGRSDMRFAELPVGKRRKCRFELAAFVFAGRGDGELGTEHHRLRAHEKWQLTAAKGQDLSFGRVCPFGLHDVCPDLFTVIFVVKTNRHSASHSRGAVQNLVDLEW